MEQNIASNEAQTHGAILEQIEVKKWLHGKNLSTKRVYISALKAFLEYTKLAPVQLIDLAEENRKKKC